MTENVFFWKNVFDLDFEFLDWLMSHRPLRAGFMTHTRNVLAPLLGHSLVAHLYTV